MECEKENYENGKIQAESREKERSEQKNKMLKRMCEIKDFFLCFTCLLFKKFLKVMKRPKGRKHSNNYANFRSSRGKWGIYSQVHDCMCYGAQSSAHNSYSLDDRTDT